MVVFVEQENSMNIFVLVPDKCHQPSAWNDFMFFQSGIKRTWGGKVRGLLRAQPSGHQSLRGCAAIVATRTSVTPTKREKMEGRDRSVE